MSLILRGTPLDRLRLRLAPPRKDVHTVIYIWENPDSTVPTRIYDYLNGRVRPLPLDTP